MRPLFDPDGPITPEVREKAARWVARREIYNRIVARIAELRPSGRTNDVTSDDVTSDVRSDGTPDVRSDVTRDVILGER